MAAAKQKLRRYIIMSADSFLNPVLFNNAFRPSTNLVARAEAAIAKPQMKVLDSIHENGPKLVEMPAEGELNLRLSMPGVKIVPEVFYQRQWVRFQIMKRRQRKTPSPKVQRGNPRPAAAYAAGHRSQEENQQGGRRRRRLERNGGDFDLASEHARNNQQGALKVTGASSSCGRLAASAMIALLSRSVYQASPHSAYLRSYAGVSHRR
ncbi:hypothetical protein [Tardiphaga sp.]|uniref:hypothetical protein n=1 Tax=Tardiphaga sp. TaxID=1926292 RepID=UPI0026283D6B|nr:hypothetical protein [Tardiphaga sp.]MDB5616080.1 hypothetical protein [Tardiphaga sp.]